ncbi:hypothetical protein ACWDO7_17140 [Streptomyces sp. NPDC003656]
MRTNAHVLIAGTMAVLAALTGCSSNTGTPKAAKPTPSYAPDSIHARCLAQHWPQPMPDLKDKRFDPLGKALVCFDHLSAMAPDGHNVMDDPADDTTVWTVTSSSPAPGTRVRLSTHIRVNLRESEG